MAHYGVLYIFERLRGLKRRGALGNLPPTIPSFDGPAVTYVHPP